MMRAEIGEILGIHADTIGRWLEREYPAIQPQAKRESAEIYLDDEAGFRNNCQ